MNISQIPSIKGTKKYYTSVHLIINIVYGTKDLLPSLLTPNIRYDFFSYYKLELDPYVYEDQIPYPGLNIKPQRSD